MKFKLGDKVRLTREAIARNSRIDFEEYEISWWEISCITDYWHYVIWKSHSDWNEKELEFISAEPKFKRWEEVEVCDSKQRKWAKGIFICEIPWALYPYICVNTSFEKAYLNWEPFCVVGREKIRKSKPKLTRKEIAEKFWVDEDFLFVE